MPLGSVLSWRPVPPLPSLQSSVQSIAEAGVQLLRRDAQQPGHLLRDDVGHEGCYVARVRHSRLDRTPIDHDAGRAAAAGREEPPERDLAVLPWCGPPRDILDGELDGGKRPATGCLKTSGGIENVVVEAIPPTRHRGHRRPGQGAARATPVAVPPA